MTLTWIAVDSCVRLFCQRCLDLRLSRLGDEFVLFAKMHQQGGAQAANFAVRKDLDEGRLKPLSVEDVPPGGLDVPMSAVWQTKSPPGPAGRWFIDRLKEVPLTNSVAKPRAAKVQRGRARRKASAAR